MSRVSSKLRHFHLGSRNSRRATSTIMKGNDQKFINLNDSLSVLFRILSSIAGFYSENLPNSSSISCLSNFLNGIVDLKHSYPNAKWFAVQLDMKGAFDNIKHDILFEIVSKYLYKSSYKLQELLILKKSKGNSVSFHRDYYLLDNWRNSTLRNCVVFPSENYKFYSRPELLTLFKTFLNNIFVELNCNCCYKFKQGVPQGFKVSSLLCSLFYYEMEQRFLHKFLNSTNNSFKLFRFVDDWIFLTINETIAIQFVQSLCHGFGRFCSIINWNKTKLNFSPLSKKIFDSTTVSFCGYLIDSDLNLTASSLINFDQGNHLSFIKVPSTKIGRFLLNYVRGLNLSFITSDSNSLNLINFFHLNCLKLKVTCFKHCISQRFLNSLIKKLYQRVCQVWNPNQSTKFKLCGIVRMVLRNKIK
ncbi:hypothetical protein P9112_011869 [Eukaryota sp. TZLM1-RC]